MLISVFSNETCLPNFKCNKMNYVFLCHIFVVLVEIVIHRHRRLCKRLQKLVFKCCCSLPWYFSKSNLQFLLMHAFNITVKMKIINASLDITYNAFIIAHNLIRKNNHSKIKSKEHVTYTVYCDLLCFYELSYFLGISNICRAFKFLPWVKCIIINADND